MSLLALAAMELALGAAPAPADGGSGSTTWPASERPVAAATIDLDLRDADLHDALRELSGKARISLFVDPDVAGQVTYRATAVPWGQALAHIAETQGLRTEALRVPGSSRPCIWVSRQSDAPAPWKEFTGAPIEVMFDQTPIRTAVETLARMSHTAITVAPGVEARVTLHLRRTPWDLALYHLAQKYRLHVARGPRGLRVLPGAAP